MTSRYNSRKVQGVMKGKKILSTLNDAVNNGDIAGASVMVLKNGMNRRQKDKEHSHVGLT